MLTYGRFKERKIYTLVLSGLLAVALLGACATPPVPKIGGARQPTPAAIPSAEPSVDLVSKPDKLEDFTETSLTLPICDVDFTSTNITNDGSPGSIHIYVPNSLSEKAGDIEFALYTGQDSNVQALAAISLDSIIDMYAKIGQTFKHFSCEYLIHDGMQYLARLSTNYNKDDGELGSDLIWEQKFQPNLR